MHLPNTCVDDISRTVLMLQHSNLSPRKLSSYYIPSSGGVYFKCLFRPLFPLLSPATMSRLLKSITRNIHLHDIIQLGKCCWNSTLCLCEASEDINTFAYI